MATSLVTETANEEHVHQEDCNSHALQESSNPAIEDARCQSPLKEKKSSKKSKDKSKKSKKDSDIPDYRWDPDIPDYRWDQDSRFGLKRDKLMRRNLERSGSLGKLECETSRCGKLKKTASMGRLLVEGTKPSSPGKSKRVKSSPEKVPTSDGSKSKPEVTTKSKKKSPEKMLSSNEGSESKVKSSGKSKKTKSALESRSGEHGESKVQARVLALKSARKMKRAGSLRCLPISTTGKPPKVKRSKSAEGLSKMRKAVVQSLSDDSQQPDYRWDKVKNRKPTDHTQCRTKSDETGCSTLSGKSSPLRVRFSLAPTLCVEVPRCTKEEKAELFYSKKEIKVFKSEDHQRKQKNVMDKLSKQMAAAEISAFGSTSVSGSPIATPCY